MHTGPLGFNLDGKAVLMTIVGGQGKKVGYFCRVLCFIMLLIGLKSSF